MATKFTKAQLEAQIAELTAALSEAAKENEVLLARLAAGHAAFKTARAEIARLSAVVADTRRAPVTKPAPVVTRFYRAGVLWEKTRVGNMATERMVA